MLTYQENSIGKHIVQWLDADHLYGYLSAHDDDDAPDVLEQAITEAAEAGVPEKEIREILAEECPETVSEIEGTSGS